MFVSRYGFDNTTGFSDLDPVVLPRLGFTYDMDEFASSARASCRAASASSRAAIRWSGSAMPSRTTASALPRAPPQAAALPGRADRRRRQRRSSPAFPQCIRQTAPARPRRASAIPSRSIRTSRCRPCGAPTSASRPVRLRAERVLQRLARQPRLYLQPLQGPVHDRRPVADASNITANAALNGFTIDGRPIYRAIDPTRRRLRCDADGDRSDDRQFDTERDRGLLHHVARRRADADQRRRLPQPRRLGRSCRRTSTAASSPRAARATSRFGYAYTGANDRRNMYNSTAGSNYDLTAAFDRQNPTASRGFYESRHNITFSGNSARSSSATSATSFGFTFVARSGRPYSLTFTGGGVFNDSVSGSDNALVYLPTGITDPNISPSSNMTAVPALVDFASGLGLRQEISRPDDPAEHLQERLVLRPRPALLAGASGPGPNHRLAARHARQGHRLCDVRQLPEPAGQRLEHPASP